MAADGPPGQVDWSQFTPLPASGASTGSAEPAVAPVDWSQFTPVSAAAAPARTVGVNTPSEFSDRHPLAGFVEDLVDPAAHPMRASMMGHNIAARGSELASKLGGMAKRGLIDANTLANPFKNSSPADVAQAEGDLHAAANYGRSAIGQGTGELLQGGGEQVRDAEGGFPNIGETDRSGRPVGWNLASPLPGKSIEHVGQAIASQSPRTYLDPSEQAQLKEPFYKDGKINPAYNLGAHLLNAAAGQIPYMAAGAVVGKALGAGADLINIAKDAASPAMAMSREELAAARALHGPGADAIIAAHDAEIAKATARVNALRRIESAAATTTFAVAQGGQAGASVRQFANDHPNFVTQSKDYQQAIGLGMKPEIAFSSAIDAMSSRATAVGTAGTALALMLGQSPMARSIEREFHPAGQVALSGATFAGMAAASQAAANVGTGKAPMTGVPEAAAAALPTGFAFGLMSPHGDEGDVQEGHVRTKADSSEAVISKSAHQADAQRESVKKVLDVGRDLASENQNKKGKNEQPRIINWDDFHPIGEQHVQSHQGSQGAEAQGSEAGSRNREGIPAVAGQEAADGQSQADQQVVGEGQVSPRAAPVAKAIHEAGLAHAVKVHADGTVAVSPGATPDEAARAHEIAGRDAAEHPENDYEPPTEAQKASGNYRKGRILLGGHKLVIENPENSIRRGADSRGNAYSRPVTKGAYGYIADTVGQDGEPVDALVGKASHDTTMPVHVFQMHDPETGAPDEHKVVMGYPTARIARAALLSNYPSADHAALLPKGSSTTMTHEQFKNWVDSRQTHVPFHPISHQPNLKLSEPSVIEATYDPSVEYDTLRQYLPRINKRFGTDLEVRASGKGYGITGDVPKAKFTSVQSALEKIDGHESTSRDGVDTGPILSESGNRGGGAGAGKPKGRAPESAEQLDHPGVPHGSEQKDRAEQEAPAPRWLNKPKSSAPVFQEGHAAHPVSVVGVHYSNKPLTEVDPGMAGTGPVTGRERLRLGDKSGQSADPLGRRSYFYVRTGKKLPEGETVVPKDHAHEAVMNNMYDVRADPEGILAHADKIGKGNDKDAILRAIHHAGYDGVVMPGIANDTPLAMVFGTKGTIPVQRVGENNASNESSASLEAIRRKQEEITKGQQRAVIHKNGNVTPLIGVDASDVHAQKGDVIVQHGIGKADWTVLSHGDDLTKPLVEGRINAAKSKLQEIADGPRYSLSDKKPQQQHLLAAEIAPNPDDKELTARWESLPDSERARVTREVGNEVVRRVAKAMHIEVDSIRNGVGGFEGHHNPNILTRYDPENVSFEKARAFAAGIGDAMKQKSVALVDKRSPGSVDIVSIRLPEGTTHDPRDIMDLIGKEMPELSGYTADGNHIDILNFTGEAGRDLAPKVYAILDKHDIESEVRHGDSHSELVEANDYEKQILGLRPELGQGVHGEIRRIGDWATARLTDAIEGHERTQAAGETGSAADAGNEARGVSSEDDYRGQHQAPGPDNGSPAWDVTRNGTYPKDVYGMHGQRYYGHGEPRLDAQVHEWLARMHRKPDAYTKVYRAVPKDSNAAINEGDWVTPIRSYAKEHGESALGANYRIVSKTVRPRDLYTDGNSLAEYGYHPQPYDRSLRVEALANKGVAGDKANLSVGDQGAPAEKPSDHAAAIQKHLDEVTKDWVAAPKPVVHESFDSAPPEVQAKVGALKPGQSVNGLYHRGEVHIFADAHHGIEDAEKTLLHETLGHYGLKTVFGQALHPLLDGIYKSIKDKPEFKALADTYRKAYGGRSAEDFNRDVTEEYLSNKATLEHDPSVLRRLTNWARIWARSHGFVRKWTDADIADLMHAVGQRAKQGAVVDDSGHPMALFDAEHVAALDARSGNGHTKQLLARGAFKAALAHVDRMQSSADAAFRSAEVMFDKRPPKQNLTDVIAFEKGHLDQISDPKVRAFFKVMQDQLADRIDRIQGFGEGQLQTLIQNYFPHIWKDPVKAASLYTTTSSRPLEGDKSFLKQRVFDTTEDGLHHNKTPISTNPVDLVRAKLVQMDKFIAMHELRSELRRLDAIAVVPSGDPMPLGYAKVKDPSFASHAMFVGKDENGEPKAFARHWDYAVPERVANDINNYLDPSFSRFKAWRSFRAFENMTLSARLGFSLFHAGMTTFDYTSSQFQLAGGELLRGNVANFAKDLGKGLGSPFSAAAGLVNRGGGAKLVRQYLGQEGADANTQAVLNALAQGGARAYSMPDQNLNAAHNFVRAIRQHNWASAAGHAIGAALEAPMIPIHRYLVPAQKMAVRVAMMKYELDRYAETLGEKPGHYNDIAAKMNPDFLRQISGKVVDQVDDRLGQMNTDNLFINKTLKQVLQATVQSVGWNLGSGRVIYGGARDIGRIFHPEEALSSVDRAGKIHTTMPRLTSRLSYLISMNVTLGMAGAIAQYLSGNGPPTSIKDLYYWKGPGGVRMSFPSYVKDEYAFAMHPVLTAEHKLHPVLGMMSDMLQNKDYYGERIFNEGLHAHEWRNVMQHVEEGIKYFGKSEEPYALQGAKHNVEVSTSTFNKYAPFVGITPAPSDISHSSFESFVSNRYDEEMRGSVRSSAQAEHAHKFSQAIQNLRLGRPPDMTGFTPEQRHMAVRDANQNMYAGMFGRLPIEERIAAYEKASPDERTKLHLGRFLFNVSARHQIENLPPDERATVLKDIRRIRDGQSP